MDLKDKVVVITGAASGIGEACTHRFTAAGAKVVATDRDEAGVQRVAEAAGTVSIAADVTQEDQVRAVASFARETYGRIDVWFSNAGVAGPPMPGELPDDAAWELGWHLHVMSHVYASRAVLPEMLARGDGYLLQTASLVALALQPAKAAYTVTKHAALSLSEWLYATYRSRGVKVSCFCPGAMLTPMLLSNDLPADHPILRSARTPEDIAELLVAAIDAEDFLVLDSELGQEILGAKGDDYQGWLRGAAMPPPDASAGT